MDSLSLTSVELIDVVILLEIVKVTLFLALEVQVPSDQFPKDTRCFCTKSSVNQEFCQKFAELNKITTRITLT